MGMELFHSGGWTTIHYTEGVEPTILVQYLEDGITVITVLYTIVFY